jgi:hypothetical protein
MPRRLDPPRSGAALARGWSDVSDDALLASRICDLPGLRDGTLARRIAPLVARLHEDLAQAGLRYLRPRVYLGDEWFSPDGLPAIAVPFYLAHPRLQRLERRMTGAVEGGTRGFAMALLRHEAGHCFDHAYGVSRRADFARVFGAAPERYRPEIYAPDPTSRAHVRHLPDFYAQAHPEEDFAETFAVLVTPEHDWRRRYADWPEARRKLEYVAGLVARFGGRRPRADDQSCDYAAERMRRTLASYYERRAADAASARRARTRLERRAPHGRAGATAADARASTV